MIYAKITDHAGNITYISSDGIVFDTVKPVIKGITDGKTYCEAQVFTVEETNLDSVLINGAVAAADDTGTYVLKAENKEYTITVTDKAGNSTLCTVTVNNGHDWNDTTYAWSDDGTSCTATRTCKNDPSHTETATGTITSKQTKAPTCTEKGETTYTATFEADWAMTQTRVLADIPAIGHSYEDGKCTVCGAADPNYKPTESGNENPDSSETDNNTQSPQTGDNSNMMLWIALLFVSGAGLFGTTAYNRKKKYIK